jgi:hypothetical protein
MTDDPMTAIEPGEIADGKTIILLQYAYVHFVRSFIIRG